MTARRVQPYPPAYRIPAMFAAVACALLLIAAADAAAQAPEATYRISGDGFEFVLVPLAQGVFAFGWVQDGELLDVEAIYHEFELEGGRAVGLTIRNTEDRVLATATRP